MTTPLKNAISWFEIPTLNLAKSQAFYETVLGCKRSLKIYSCFLPNHHLIETR